MAVSKIGICNIALAMLGADPIRSFDENNKRARMADVFYDSTRDYLLSKFDWPFARKLLALQPIDAETMGVTVPAGFFLYQLPADCRTPRDVLPSGSRTQWAIMSNMLYCRIDPDSEVEVILKYTKQAADTAIYSDTFINLLALGIAVKMCPAITQDKQLTATLMDQFNVEQANAWESDANIGEEYRKADEQPENDTFVNVDGFYDPYLRA